MPGGSPPLEAGGAGRSPGRPRPPALPPAAHGEAGEGPPRGLQRRILRIPPTGDDGGSQHVSRRRAEPVRAAPEPRGASRRDGDAPDRADASRARAGGSPRRLLAFQPGARAVRPSRGPRGPGHGDPALEGAGGRARGSGPSVPRGDPRAHPDGGGGPPGHPAPSRTPPVRAGGPRPPADDPAG